METLWQDLRFGFRMLAKSPGFTAVAVLTLALGIGANTAIFSVVNAVLLRPLDYSDPDQLYVLWGHHPQIGREVASLPDFVDWREQNQSFEDLAAMSRRSMNLTGRGEAERVIGARVSASLFPLLRVETIRGRAFSPEEDRPGAERVAILSHGLWQRRFGSDPAFVGETITLDGESYAVIGVAPPEFQFPGRVEVWIPLAMEVDPTERRGDFLLVLGRLKPGVTQEQAQAEMTTIAQRLEQQYPNSNTKWGIEIVSLHEQVVGNIRPALLVLLGAVGFVLLIACANVANLLLARAAAREKEIAVRAALGAGRGRLVRQLLTESLLVAIIGGALGLLLALWGIDILLALNPDDVPRLSGVGVDGWVLGFTLGISLLTGILFGLVPAVQISRPDLHESLKEGGRTSGGSLRHRTRHILVVAEVALALVLLIGAGLMIRSFDRLQRVSPGFNPENLLTMRISLPPAKYPERQHVLNFFDQLLERVRSLPGVQSASTIDNPYIGGGGNYLSFIVEGQPTPPLDQVVDAQVRSVTPGFHRMLGVPLLRGRSLTGQDGPGNRLVCVINETMARRYFPDRDPLGQRVAFDGPDGQPRWREIVGVVGDVRQGGLDAEPYPEILLPEAQRTIPAITLMVRTANDPHTLAGAVRGEVQAMDPDQPVYAVRTMDDIMKASVAQRRFNMLLLGSFAAVALLLAAVGIYGVISYSVSRRTHELGIRMALGAQPRDIFKLVVGQGMVLVVIGVGIGLAASFGLTRFLSSLLFEVSTTDPATFAGVSLLLAAVALLACYIPARRATRVDPLVALRYE